MGYLYALLALSFAISAVGWIYFIYFFSIGYGFSISALGYIGIVYVMFSGARRLELRQNETYGHDPEFRAYIKRTPLILPFVPIYSVAKYRWLKG